MNEKTYCKKLVKARELYSKRSVPYLEILADIQIFKSPQYLYDSVSNTLTPINKDTEVERQVKEILEQIHSECYKNLL